MGRKHHLNIPQTKKEEGPRHAGLLFEQLGQSYSDPGIAQEDETWNYATFIGPMTYARNAGELLHPARDPQHVLDALRTTLGEYSFSAQYLQSPVPLGGGIVKADWLTTYTPEEKPEKFETIVQSWDTANKESELADYSVCTTWGVKNKQMYLLHVLRKRMP